MSHDTHSLLSLLPYPLLESTEQTEIEQIANFNRRAQPYSPSTTFNTDNDDNTALNHQCLEEMIDIRALDLQPEESLSLVSDLNLKHVVGTFYVQHEVVITPRHKLIALGFSVPRTARKSGRFSRTTAGWVWGLIPLPEHIHMDFDRLKRPNQEILKRNGLTVHQVTLHPLDGMQYHDIMCTTPVKTVVDLIVHHENLALDVLPKPLATAPFECTPENIIHYIQDTPYIRNKRRAVDIVKVIEALGRIQ